MKKIYKISSFLAVAVIGMMTVSCKEDKIEYKPGVPPGGDAAYFNPDLSSTFDLETDGSSFNIVVYRTETKGNLTVPITVTPQEGNTVNEAFTFPSSVTFEDGENTANFTVDYDITMFEEGDSYLYDEEQQFLLEIDEEYITPYGISNILITAVLPAPWITLGEGTYIDEGWYVNDDGPETTVTFYQNELDPYLFRITNPYEFEMTVARPEYFQFRILQPGQTVLNQTIPDDLGVSIVYYVDFPVEYHPTYDEDVYLLFPGRFGWPVTQWVYNYVVDWQDADSVLPGEIHLSPYYFLFGQSGGWNYTTDEPITMIFPGFESIDTSIAVTYNGMLSKPDDSLEAVAYVEIGADVTEAKVALINGSSVTSDDITAITDGSIESQSISASGQVNLPFDAENEAGKYTIVAVSYYNGEARANATATFQYTPSNATPETWSLVGEGLYTYLSFWEENLGLEPEVLELYESDTTPGNFKITHWMNDQDFLFTLEDDGTIVVAEEQNTGVTAGGVEVWVDDLSFWGDESGSLEDGIYNFNVIYYNSQTFGYYDYGTETFEPVTAGTSAASYKAKSRSTKFNFEKGHSVKLNARANMFSKYKKADFGIKYESVIAK